MRWTSPGRLFHAVVLAGASFGAAGCGSRTLGRDATDVADARDASDGPDAPPPDVAMVDAMRDAVRIDTSVPELDGTADADCDVVCVRPMIQIGCRCEIGIL